MIQFLRPPTALSRPASLSSPRNLPLAFLPPVCWTPLTTSDDPPHPPAGATGFRKIPIHYRVLGIDKAALRSDTTADDPTCGSASLLLKLASLALHSKGVKITLCGQEKDSSTAGLARMNMILHDCPTAEIKQGNMIANPLFLDRKPFKINWPSCRFPPRSRG